jgi:hypothetical protein
MNKSGSSRAVVTIDDFMQTPQAEKYLLDKLDYNELAGIMTSLRELLPFEGLDRDDD